MTGPNSVLTYWRHSIHDICARVDSVGFTTRIEKLDVGYGIDSAKVVVARK